jgi:hypothetical protein
MNPPPGLLAIEYPDHDDVIAKSTAAEIRVAFDNRETKPLFRLFEQTPQIVKKVFESYDAYFNDYTGKGLFEDIYQEITDPDALLLVEGMMCIAGIKPRGQVNALNLHTIDDDWGYKSWIHDSEFMHPLT